VNTSDCIAVCMDTQSVQNSYITPTWQCVSIGYVVSKRVTVRISI